MSRGLAACAAIFVPIVILSVASRYRMSDAVGRQQLKWFALAQMLTLAAVGMAAFGALITRNPPEAGLALFGFVGALIPVAIGIAILRYTCTT